MMNVRTVKLRGCNCKYCRGYLAKNHHFYQNTMRKSYTGCANKKLRRQAKIECLTLGENPIEGVGGFWFD